MHADAVEISQSIIFAKFVLLDAAYDYYGNGDSSGDERPSTSAFCLILALLFSMRGSSSLD